MSRCLFQVANSAGNACVVEPELAAAQIQLAQGSREPASKKHLAEVLSLGQIRHIGVALQPLPAHHLELCAERLLDEAVFPLNLHAAARVIVLSQLPAARLPRLSQYVSRVCRKSCREFVASFHNSLYSS